MTKLPSLYLQRMKELLKDEYDDYLNSFSEERTYGLRVNTSKISVEDFLKISPFELTPIPWTQDGFYYEETQRPAKHPYYYAGLYYLQEPSAMLPAEVLPIEEDDLVLDCCAAPGGKSLKLFDKLNKTGLLISNDVSISRAQTLMSNLERHGVSNAYVTAQDICNIHQWDQSFDKILIDAPCSGEGMFRKDHDLIASWQKTNPDDYSAIQKKIATSCLSMLKPGGMILYSTCTFNPKEDEEIIEYLLSIDTSLSLMNIDKTKGFASGITEKSQNCLRLYPHRIKGEGHFVALLKKDGSKEKTKKHFCDLSLSNEIPKEYHAVLKQGDLLKRNQKYYLVPAYDLPLENMRILRSGLYLGEMRHDHFEPSQALAMALNPNDYENTIRLHLDDERVLKYLKCETLNVSDFNVKGNVLVCLENYPLGFGKVSGGILKNRYPANYRYL